MLFAAGIIIASIVAGTSAQVSGISAGCRSAATGLLAGPAAQCLAVSALLNIAVTPANQSMVPGIDSWLSASCSQPACGTDVLRSAISNVTSGCATEFGLTAATAVEVTDRLVQTYPIGRQAVCLQDSNASNAFCFTSTLKNLEGEINEPMSIQSLFSGSFANKVYLESSSLPKSFTCTNCIQATYALIRPKLTDAHRGTWDNYLSGQCGLSFIIGSSPSSIVQGANSATQGASGNGALSLARFGVLETAFFSMVGVAAFGL